MLGLLMVFSIVPLGLGFALQLMFGKSKLSKSLFVFMLLISLWQMDVAVLFARRVFEPTSIEVLFRLLRLGHIMLPAGLMYIAHTIYGELVDKHRVSPRLRRLYGRGAVALFVFLGLVVYTIGWTPLGVKGLYLVRSEEAFAFYYPDHGPWNVTFQANALLFFYGLVLCGMVTRYVTNYHIRFFLRILTVTCFCTYIIGLFNMTPVSGLYPNSITVLLFAIALFIGFCHMHAKVVEEKEDRLQAQHTFLRSIIDLNPNYIYAKDPEGNYLMVNQSFARLMGMEPEELVGLKEEELRLHEEMERVRLHETSLKQGGESSAKNLEETLTAPSGEVRWVQTAKLPLITDKEKQGLILCVSTDITERKRAEELLRTSEKLSMAGELAAGVAHEIRNPLTSIRGFVQLLQRKADSSQSRYLDIMLSEMDRINLIVNEFLMLSKPQAVRFERKSLNEMLNKVVMLLETQANLNNVSIVADLGQEERYILCEENQMKQVFVNLLKNGIEAMPNGGLLRLELRKCEADKVKIRFEDHGSGISPELLQKLGQPFYTTKEKGTGLGLMVSFKIIETHNGTIQFKSKLGEGTVIDITLPEAQSPQ